MANDDGQDDGDDEYEPVTQPQTTEPVASKPQPTNALIPPMTWILSVPRGVRAELKIIGTDVQPQDLLRLKEQIDFLCQSFEVIIPITCEKCRSGLSLSVAHSGGFGYMNEHAFACPVCGTVRRQLLPGPVKAVAISSTGPDSSGGS